MLHWEMPWLMTDDQFKQQITVQLNQQTEIPFYDSKMAHHCNQNYNTFKK